MNISRIMKLTNFLLLGAVLCKYIYQIQGFPRNMTVKRQFESRLCIYLRHLVVRISQMWSVFFVLSILIMILRIFFKFKIKLKLSNISQILKTKYSTGHSPSFKTPLKKKIFLPISLPPYPWVS